MVAENWNDKLNEYGYAGMASSNGPAGHGGSSKYEMHIALIAFGPSFKPALRSDLPSSNVDLIPTILSIYKFPVPKTMQGRVLDELLVNGRPASSKHSAKVKKLLANNPSGANKYSVTMEVTEYNGFSYINYIQANR